MAAKKGINKISCNIDDELGGGVFGVVFSGFFIQKDGSKKEVAVKRIELRHVKVNKGREASVMKQLDHRYVLKLLETEEDANFKYFALERALGTLKDYIDGKYQGEIPGPLDGQLQMAEGLYYIHWKNFVHRDIKPANILIFMVDGSAIFKIGDFGFTKPTTDNGSFSLRSGVHGTPNFMGPEIYLEPKGSSACDIFALGCVVYLFLTKKHPFDINSTRIVENIRKDAYSLAGNDNAVLTVINIYSDSIIYSDLPNDYYATNLIRDMIQKDPKQRPKSQAVLRKLRDEGDIQKKVKTPQRNHSFHKSL
jgi:serine/threonine protein kinase